MRKINMITSVLFCIVGLILSSCSGSQKDKLIDEIDFDEISQREILGIYQVKDSNIESIKNGDTWEIKVKGINRGELGFEPYVFQRNVLVVNTEHYRFERKSSQEFTVLSEEKQASFILQMKEDKEDDKGSTEEFDWTELVGYAQYGGTIGGADADTSQIYHFSDGSQFKEWLAMRQKTKSKTPAIVWLSGVFTKEDGRSDGYPWFDIKDTENISIYGVNGFVMQHVGIQMVRSHNIIIRNLYIQMPKADNGADAIAMKESSRIWVDHCSFESMNSDKDYEDGACDITHGTKNVTVSWCHFIKTKKTSLVGHSDKEIQREIDSQITATYHHNFFEESNSRHPRVRYGTVHVYNNYYKNNGTYGVGSAMSAKVLVEGNCFDGVHLPTDISTFPAKKVGSKWVSNLVGAEAGFLLARDNQFDNIPSKSIEPYPFTNTEYQVYDVVKLKNPLTTSDFMPPYIYEMIDADKIKQIVMQYVGAGVLPLFDEAQVRRVD